ncbi:TPA: P22AR C-terminal domain-containing protein [Haemophilus influenzae]|uniref:P22AR C-terminal domain-containing protein n=1 Tax=Haemophilus influenzae TaxID=727 RepID=UPI0005AEEFD2|nr:P22AR C-terminal domain-containing protein [Haemophilus influenzae]KIP36986.1 antirepressor [Haemophilus influenzae]KIP42203.1 antirepressor [Haemophilus influenzae]KIP47079.1 antirepressor [Haemophilus influenzae]MCK8903626.1 phage repressor protein/antirepressor Ant [Haemophilus influenzae]MCK8976816.1 phage repressor protein/antirepressor Ant [Haemophilus influenzae]
MTIQSQFSTFNFESNSIRTLVINNEPWFVAKDVCDTLKISNISDALLKLDDDEKATIGLTDSQAGNGAQSISIISESGMYTLILRCRDAVKKGSIPHRFRKWVTAEVLPTIRKTGKYESKTTVDDRTGLRNAVNMLVSKKGLIYSEAYHLVHQRFNVESIEDLTLEQLPEAVEYVHKIILERELITEAELPSREKKFSFEFTEYELQQLIWLWFAFKRGVGTFQHIERAFNVLGSNMSGQIYGQAYEYLSVLRSTNKILNRITQEFEIDPMTNWRALEHLRKFDQKAVKIDF